MKKIIKKIGTGLFLCFVLLQFVRPHKNENPVEVDKQITAIIKVPEEVNLILKTSCYDCHSNNTIYPWYSDIQPVYFWLTNHIREGKREINFDEFATYSIRKQYKKMGEIIEQLNEDEMPLSSYALIHKDAKLTDAEKATVTNWATSVMDLMKATYPIDSLIKKKS